MRTPIGQTLRQYKILSRIGEDFTGILYKALDTEVGRTVALRTLGPKIAANPELRARIEHDVLAASMLNHPSIARIYEFAKADDVDFVVMEAPEGEPFDDFLRGEPRDWRLVLLYGRQIASALAAAHGARIVHGPLNPGRIFSHNEKLTIYDFGFGVQEAPPESEPDRKALFGKSSAYISPEQIQGNSPDERSDIFSFGALLYHMSTGHPPFYRATLEASWKAVLKSQPEPIWRSDSRAVPGMSGLIARCLAKKPQQRFKNIAEIDPLLAKMEEFHLRNPNYQLSLLDKYRKPILAAALFVLAVGAAAVLRQKAIGKDNSGSPIGSSFRQVTRDKGLDAEPAISADGSLLAYSSDRNSDGNLDVWVQPASGDGQPLQLTNDPADDREPAFSPDGSTIVFRSDRNGGGIYLIPAKGGAARLIASEGRRPRFSPDGRWIAYWTSPPDLSPKTTGAYKIFIVPSAGGAPRQIRPDFAYCMQPIWAPDSKSLLFIGKPDPLRNSPEQFDWWVSSIETGKHRKTGVYPLCRREAILTSSGTLVPADWKGNYVFFSTPGAVASHVWRAGIDPAEWTIAASPVKVTPGAGIEIDPVLTTAGDLFFSRQSYNAGVWTFPVGSNSGKATGPLKRLTDASAIALSPSLSVDGSRLLFQSYRSGAYKAMLLGLPGGKESTVSAGSAEQIWPIISPDGSKAAWTEPRLGGRFEQFYKTIGGSLTENLCGQCGLAVSGWSPDGTSVLLDTFRPASSQLAVGLMELSGLKKTMLLQDERYELHQARFSSDGRWIVFVGNVESGSSRVFVAPYQGPRLIASREWIEITSGNGWETRPQFSPDGTLVYYTSRRDGNRCVWAQRLDAAHRPSGEAFAVYHFHMMRRSPAALPFEDADLFVARDQVLVSLAELSGNVWKAKVLDTPAGAAVK